MKQTFSEWLEPLQDEFTTEWVLRNDPKLRDALKFWYLVSQAHLFDEE